LPLLRNAAGWWRHGDPLLKTLLLTGAAGEVGEHLRRELAGRYSLRLTDVRPVGALSKGERFRKADLARWADVLRVSKGVDAVVHMGAYSVEGNWEQILQANIVGCYNVFEAARRNGVKRVVFASSSHVLGFHARKSVLDHHAEPRPDSRDGVSKGFGEALARLYADKYGLEVCCLRIGTVQPAPTDKRRLSLWVSPRDLAQLVTIGVEHPAIRFEVLYGVSGNKRSFYDNANATRLGYRPQDNSEQYAKAVLARERPSAEPRVEKYQGGIFTVAEQLPNPAAARAKSRRR
jgi:uronate dehydrogenase